MLSLNQFERARRWPRSQRVELYFDLRPFDYQADILDDGSAKLAWNAARRSGKTTVAVAIPALRVIERPGSESAVFALSKTQAKRMFEATKGNQGTRLWSVLHGIRTPETKDRAWFLVQGD